MDVNFNNLDAFVAKETLKVIRETLDAHLGDDSDERRRQQRQAKIVKKQKLHADDAKDETNEAEEEEVDEVEEEEVEEKGSGVPDSVDDSTEDKKPREDRTGGKGTEDSPKLDTPTLQQLKKPSVGAVIDKLNALRGGRSLKDPEVKKSFSQYFNNLTQNERETMLVFLTGLSQILAGVSNGVEAIDPGDVGLRVKDKPGETKSAQKELNQQKEDEKERESLRPGSAASPIVVGESQNKYKLKKLLDAYRRYK